MVLPIKRTTNGDLSQMASGDTLTLTVDGTGLTVAARDLSSSAALTPGADLVGVNTLPLVNSAPLATDLQTVLEALDAAGVTDMQGAYDGGPDITLDASGSIDIVDAATNLAPQVMSLTASGAGARNVLKVARAPTVGNTAGDGINVALGSNSSGQGVAVVNAGVGRPAQLDGTGATTPATRVSQAFGNALPALEVDHAGSGGGILVTSFSGSGVTVDFALAGGGAALDVNIGASVNALGLDVQQAGTAVGATIDATNIASFSNALNVTQAGTARGISVTHTGTGDGIAIDTTGGAGGDGIQINAAAGFSAINAGVAGSNVLRVDDLECKIGDSGGVVLVQTYGKVVLGIASNAEAKTLDMRTTFAATTLAPTNDLGQLVTRPGVETAASTIAELAYQAGSAATETLLTKGGRLYATALIREFIIGTGGVAVGEVVAMNAATSTVVKADPVTANATDNAFGVVIAIEGTGIATERALVAMGGFVDGLAGLTANTPVYLDDTTPGLLTSTVPVAIGTTSIRIGFAFSQSSIIIHVGEKVLIP